MSGRTTMEFDLDSEAQGVIDRIGRERGITQAAVITIALIHGLAARESVDEKSAISLKPAHERLRSLAKDIKGRESLSREEVASLADELDYLAQFMITDPIPM